jgi:hypothetical protein
LTSNNSLLGKKLSSQQISTFAKANLPIYLIVFFSAGVLKTVTELVAYPYPIGYDVINYYIPMLSDFENELHTILNEYPVYIYILHFVQILSGLSPQTTVTSFSIFVYGIFAVSIFSVGKAIIKNDTLLAALLSLFVIIQIPVLRTAWDLHRDMFSIAMMLFAVSFLIRIHNNHFSRIPLRLLIPCFSFTILSVISDRMVGGWLVLVLCIYSVLNRERMVTLCAIVSLALFLVFLFITGHGNIILDSVFNDVIDLNDNGRIPGAQILVDSAYNQTNLLVYLISMNVLLIPLAVVGFFRLKERILRLSLITAMLGSVSWIVFPHASQLVADRWILLFGMTLSIFAGYGFINTVQRISKSVRNHIRFASLSIAIFVLFALLGIAYAVLSYDGQVSLIGLFAKNVEKFAPISMQFNSIRVEDSPMMLDLIDWINTHTATDSKILGSNHWRGWFVSGLEGNRSFVGYVGPNSSLTNAIGRYSDHFYLVDVKGKDDLNHNGLSGSYEVVNLHSNDLFSIYQLSLGARNITSMH